MTYDFKINGDEYISLSFYTSFDKYSKELAFFIYDFTEQDRLIFLENKKNAQLNLINMIVDFFVLDLNGIKYAFEFNDNKDLINQLFNTKELEIGFAFQDSNENLINELCFTVDY